MINICIGIDFESNVEAIYQVPLLDNLWFWFAFLFLLGSFSNSLNKNEITFIAFGLIAHRYEWERPETQCMRLRLHWKSVSWVEKIPMHADYHFVCHYLLLPIIQPGDRWSANTVESCFFFQLNPKKIVIWRSRRNDSNQFLRFPVFKIECFQQQRPVWTLHTLNNFQSTFWNQQRNFDGINKKRSKFSTKTSFNWLTILEINSNVLQLVPQWDAVKDHISSTSFFLL